MVSNKAYCLDMHFIVFIKVDAVCEAKVYAGALLFLMPPQLCEFISTWNSRWRSILYSAG
jgi:hypothetical protein